MRGCCRWPRGSPRCSRTLPCEPMVSGSREIAPRSANQTSSTTRFYVRALSDCSYFITGYVCDCTSESIAPSCQVGSPFMPNATYADLIDASAAPARQSEIIKDRRRPGRIQNGNPALIPLFRNPTGAVAGDLCPIDRPQIVALWAASAYPADVWRSMTATEQSAVIVGEMQEMVERVASVDVPPVGEGPRRSRRHTSR
jgi:hypothetical protein